MSVIEAKARAVAVAADRYERAQEALGSFPRDVVAQIAAHRATADLLEAGEALREAVRAHPLP